MGHSSFVKAHLTLLWEVSLLLEAEISSPWATAPSLPHRGCCREAAEDCLGVYNGASCPTQAARAMLLLANMPSGAR